MKKNITLAIVIALVTLTACGKVDTPTDTTPVDTTVVETTVEPTVEEQDVEQEEAEVIEVQEDEVVEETAETPTEEVVEVPEEPIVEEPVVAEPTYTVTYFAEPKVMYCQEFSNFRVKPEQGATVSYTKNTNATVTVVGTCTENGWYYIEDGAWTLASNLGDNEVVVATAPETPSTTPTAPANSGYPAPVQEMLNNGAEMFWDMGITNTGLHGYNLYKDGYHYTYAGDILTAIYYVDPNEGLVYTYMGTIPWAD